MFLFNIIKPIGNGAFSEVYLGTKINSNKLVAIKKIKLNLQQKYLENEINILSQIQHQNIIKLYETLEYDKNKFLVIEYCNGGSLHEYLYKYVNTYGKPFPEKLVQYLMKQILQGVKYLHDRGIIHRDLKLQNILLNYEKNNPNIYNAKIKIIDFNSSYILNNSRPKTVVGTLENMAPSIIYNIDGTQKYYDEKVDIWSLGTLCYEMLFGKPLFPNMNKNQIINKISSYNFNIPKTISVQARTFLKSMLQKEGINRLTTHKLLKSDFIIGDYHKFTMNNCINNSINNSINNNYMNKQLIRSETKTVFNIPNLNDFDKSDNNNNFKCNGCGKSSNVLYKCQQCYNLICCQNCYFNLQHKHNFQKIINIPHNRRTKSPENINKNYINLLFKSEDGCNDIAIKVEYNDIIDKILKSYLKKVHRDDLINIYDYKLNFLYEAKSLNNYKNMKIGEIIRGNLIIINVIEKRNVL